MLQLWDPAGMYKSVQKGFMMINIDDDDDGGGAGD